MNNTLRFSFALRNAYKVNTILYSLKQIPLIKRILPDGLYSSRGLKIFANIVAVIWEFVSAFLGKFLYFMLMVFYMLDISGGQDKGGLFLHILLFLSIIGALMNTFLFNPTRDKYYGIILLRMDAREYALTDYCYCIIKLLAGFLVFGIYFGRLAGVPLWLCLMLPFYVAGLKLSVAAYELRKYEKTGQAINENIPPKFIWVTAGVCLGAAYGLPLLKIVVPQWAAASFMGLFILSGILSARKIFTFKHYDECLKQLLHSPVIFQKDAAAKALRDRSDKLISADVSISSNKRGFEYLNELFIKRHQKLLWKTSKRIALAALIILGIGLLAMKLSTEFSAGFNKFLLTGLPLSVFVMYIINRGQGFTQVLFLNCDHSLLTYSFYKQPEFVLKLFSIRLREIIKVNLLPAVIIGLGLTLMLYVSGGTKDVLNYAVLALSIPALSVFFSVHYLTAYYLLQPYNANTEIKSGAYQIVLSVTYLACFFFMQLKLSTLMFGAMTILFCVLYCGIACILVYRIAPKTFKMRS